VSADSAEALGERIAEAIAAKLESVELPDRLYGLVLAYSLGGLSAYTWPLFEQTRSALLAQEEEPYALWDPSSAQADQLPPGVSEDLPKRDLDVPLYEDESLAQAYEAYRGQPRDDPAALARVSQLWGQAAAALTRRRFTRLEVTDDFVALAFPNEWRDVDIVEALQTSLGPERFDAFAARGWIPE
jgi:hypothetical protein